MLSSRNSAAISTPGPGCRLLTSSTFSWDIAAQYPAVSGVGVSVLLRQACGFEGLFQRVVLIDPRDHAISDLIDVSELVLDRDAAGASDAAVPLRDDHAIFVLDEVERLDVVLPERLYPLAKRLGDASPAL